MNKGFGVQAWPERRRLAQAALDASNGCVTLSYYVQWPHDA